MLSFFNSAFVRIVGIRKRNRSNVRVSKQQLSEKRQDEVFVYHEGADGFSPIRDRCLLTQKYREKEGLLLRLI